MSTFQPAQSNASNGGNSSPSNSPNGPIRLVVLDLDGTALNRHHQFSEKTIETLRRLSARNITIALATGRSSLSVRPLLEVLQLPQPTIPVVCFNGAVLLSVTDGSHEVLYAKTLSQGHARTVIEFAHTNGHCVQYYNGDSGHVYAAPSQEVHYKLMQSYVRVSGTPQIVVETFDELIDQFGPAKMMVLTDDSDSLFAHCLAESLHTELSVVKTSPESVEFMAGDANKGTALVYLSEYLNVPLHQIVAFGDGNNDIEMLTTGCRGVAMLNAGEGVRAVAVEVTEHTNHEDGVAKHLDKLEALGLFEINLKCTKCNA
jgi:Cof subfamily protein (haloacid dehalogenase superfamily)